MRSLWEDFKVILLVTNHRQQGDYEFTELLKRASIGKLTDQDIKLLETRVVKKGDPMVPTDGIYVFPVHKQVNEYNQHSLMSLPEDLITLEAINILPGKSNFEPILDYKGNIRNTPMKPKLQLKVGCPVMCTYNVNLDDFIANGSKGIVLGFTYNTQNKVDNVVVKFDYEQSGEQIREKCSPSFLQKFPGGTPISRFSFTYSLSRTAHTEGQKAKVIQFPLVLCFATTIHKMEGQTVIKPKAMVTSMKKVFQPAQGYVAISRPQSLQQLYFLDELVPQNIYPDQAALAEIDRLTARSYNNTSIGRKLGIVKVACVNVCRLQPHIHYLRKDHKLLENNLLFCCQTWLTDDDMANTSDLQVDGYNATYVNVGNGKGIAGYAENMFKITSSICEHFFQILKYEGTIQEGYLVDVIAIYRSASANESDVLEVLQKLANPERMCIIVGDLNVCYKKERYNKITIGLEHMGFSQKINDPTHIAGGHIDHLYIFKPAQYSDVDVKWELHFPFYTDHAAICVSLNTSAQKST